MESHRILLPSCPAISLASATHDRVLCIVGFFVFFFFIFGPLPVFCCFGVERQEEPGLTSAQVQWGLLWGEKGILLARRNI